MNRDSFNTLIKPLHERFESELLPRYRGLQGPEQRIVKVAAVVLPLMILLFGIMLPLHDRQLELLAAQQSLQLQATEAEQLAQRLVEAGPSQRGGGAGKASAMTLVEQLARQFKLREYMTRIRPQPSPHGGQKQLMVQLQEAPYAGCIQLIDALARKGGDLVSIRMKAGKEAGFVNLQMVIGG